MVKSVRPLCILGSTGSIGTQALDIVRLFPDRLRVSALSTNRNAELLVQQALEFRSRYVAVADATRAPFVERSLAGTGIRVLAGEKGIESLAASDDVEVVIAAISGVAGLKGVLAALKTGKTVALANKETLVVAGALARTIAAESRAELIPVDSEHSAIFQCLVGEPEGTVESITLTASGGPFRTRPVDSFGHITLEEALIHPNWSMGRKITIDSATMMNKGLEVIEAHWLFGLAANQIHVLVHPQSIIHSMVTFTDGSTKAQLGLPDMRLPIQYALSHPDRWAAAHERADYARLGRLDFEEPDLTRFPCLGLAYDALRTGGAAPAVLNAANESAVALFLEGRLRFVDIPIVVEHALEQVRRGSDASLEDLLEADRAARRCVVEHDRAMAI